MTDPADQMAEGQGPAKGRWERLLRGRKLAMMWLTTAIIGSLCITLFHALSTVRLLAPVLLLISYAAYGLKYVKNAGVLVALRQARITQLADSLYFLGFLWTLYALIDSFVLQRVSIAEAVFQSFGYALITTAMGMFLRLLLLQFSYSDADQVELGERHVEEEIVRFSGEMRRAVDGVNVFRRKTENVVVEWSKSLTKITQGLEDVSKVIDSQVVHHNKLEKEIQGIGIALENGKKRVVSASEEFSKAMALSLPRIGSSVDGVVAKIEAIEVPNDLVEKALKVEAKAMLSPMEKSIERFAHSLEELHGRVQAIDVPEGVVRDVVTRQLSGVAQKVEKDLLPLRDAMSNLSKEIKGIKIPADIVEKTISAEVSHAMEGLITNISSIQQALDRLLQTVNALNHSVDQKPWWKKIV